MLLPPLAPTGHGSSWGVVRAQHTPAAAAAGHCLWPAVWGGPVCRTPRHLCNPGHPWCRQQQWLWLEQQQQQCCRHWQHIYQGLEPAERAQGVPPAATIWPEGCVGACTCSSRRRGRQQQQQQQYSRHCVLPRGGVNGAGSTCREEQGRQVRDMLFQAALVRCTWHVAQYTQLLDVVWIAIYVDNLQETSLSSSPPTSIPASLHACVVMTQLLRCPL
jgi:hypothetical protein